MKYRLAENSRADFIAYAPMHTFKGWVVKGLTGQLDIDTETLVPSVIQAEARTECFDTGDGERNKAMMDFFHFEKHPLASFTLTQCNASRKSGQNSCRATLVGVLELAGIQRQLPITTDIQRAEERLTMDLKFKWSFKAYGIKAPRLLFLTVRDIVDISAHLEFLPSEK